MDSKTLETNRYRKSIEQCSLGFLTWYENQVGGLYTEESRSLERCIPLHSSSIASSIVISKTSSSIVYKCGNFAYKHILLSAKENRLAYLRMAIRELWFLHNFNHSCLLSSTRSQILMQHGRIYRLIHEFPLAHGTLELLVNEGYLLTRDECKSILSSLIHAVNHLHLLGIVHGDIKAANIFKMGSAWKLGDFSLSTCLNEQSAEVPMGSLGWAAPELESSDTKYTYACDIWSIGKVAEYLYRRCTDPFVKQVMDLCMKFDPVDRVKIVELMQLEGLVPVIVSHDKQMINRILTLKDIENMVAPQNPEGVDYKDEKWETLQNMLVETYMEKTGQPLRPDSVICKWGATILQSILNTLYMLKATYQMSHVLATVLNLMLFVWQGSYDPSNTYLESEMYHVLTLSGFHVPLF